MSALIALMDNENLTSVFENVFLESAGELLAGLNDEDLAKVAQYVAMLKEKKVKPAEEAEISEALVPVLEHNAALYGTFLYESVEEELNEEDAKKLLETVREHFGREFIIEALSAENKARLKKAAKIAGGVGAAGLAAGAAYAKRDEIGDYAKKGVDAVKKLVSGDKDKSVSMGQAERAQAAQAARVADNDPGSKTIYKKPATPDNMSQAERGTITQKLKAKATSGGRAGAESA